MTPRYIVVKVGGSLLDLPGLGPRLRAWLDGQTNAALILVAGGGPTADVIRAADDRHGLGEETAHWLALRALSLNSHLLAALVPRTCVVEALSACRAAWDAGLTPILDPLPIMHADEARPDRLPHRWTVTSDSVAARIAHLAGAAELVLLKSRHAPTGAGWDELARAGLVDEWLPRMVPLLPAVRMVNFRAHDH
jgi:aspartokinase-like uncharacterized kinase